TEQHRGWRQEGVLSAYQPVDGAMVQSLFEQAAQRGINDPLLFGLVPFNAANKASMAIPVRRAHADIPAKASVATNSGKTRPNIIKREPVPAPEQYGDMVRSALN